MLRWNSSWRYFTRDYVAFRGLFLSLIASCVHSGFEVQEHLIMSYFMFALRSIRPPSLEPHVHAKIIVDDCIAVAEGENASTSLLSGRQESLVDLLPLTILPDLPPESSSKLMKRYVNQLSSHTLNCRKLAGTAILSMLLPVWKSTVKISDFGDTNSFMSLESIVAAKTALKEELEERGDVILTETMKAVRHTYHSLSFSKEEGANRRIGGTSKDVGVTLTITTKLLNGLEWPMSSTGLKAVRNAHFSVRNARVIQVMSHVAPDVVLRVFEGPITEILSCSQDKDKPAVAAVAEILAGILASGIAFQDDKDSCSPWNSWVGPCLKKALENAPLDFLDVWSECVLRFAVNGLLENNIAKSEESISLIVEAAVPQGLNLECLTSSTEIYKRVNYLTDILCEIETYEPKCSAPRYPKVHNFLSDCILKYHADLTELARKRSGSDMVRQAVSGLVVDFAMTGLTSSHYKSTEANDSPLLIEKINEMLEIFFVDFDNATELLFDENKDKVLAAGDSKFSRMEEDVENKDGVIDDPMQTSDGVDVEGSDALTQIAFGCELVFQLLSCTSADTSPWIIRGLGNMMRVFELIPSEAQLIVSSLRMALRSAKYQPVKAQEVETWMESVIKSMSGSLWTERAAALSFLQYFWFRNALVLGASGSERVIREAIRLLEDPKLEVRELASATVSGVIRALPEEKQRQIRQEMLTKAAEMFPETKKRKVDRQLKSNAAVAERHGAALGLNALVMASPYDVPNWLPEILMALVRISSEPAPVRKTVTGALADFRRTHEEGGLLEMKDAMTSEQWEAIRDVATPASYFV